jgi:5-oxopent-3-ene-1,2,5-tricarboxylate decarboxylase/2-hydroxyhepta-2,4-diene-1,7-dioate isomerase
MQLAGESLPRDVSAAQVRARIAAGASIAAPRVGTVYATLLNDRCALAALDAAFHAAPYHKPPTAPILYVKPRNTLVGHGAGVCVPQDAPGLCVGGSLGILIGRVASRVTAERALDYVAGYLIVADLSVPNDDFFRLPVRDLIRDGFCVLGPAVVAARHVPDPDALEITVNASGQPSFKTSTANCVRGVAKLLADVTDFMTLAPGDVLTLGVPWGAPVARAGDTVSVGVGGWPPLRFMLAAGGDATR